VRPCSRDQLKPGEDTDRAEARDCAPCVTRDDLGASGLEASAKRAAQACNLRIVDRSNEGQHHVGGFRAARHRVL